MALVMYVLDIVINLVDCLAVVPCTLDIVIFWIVWLLYCGGCSGYSYLVDCLANVLREMLWIV